MRKRLVGSAVAVAAVLAFSSGMSLRPRGNRERQSLRRQTSQEFGGDRGARPITLAGTPFMSWLGPLPTKSPR